MEFVSNIGISPKSISLLIRPMNRVYLSLGSNEGNRLNWLRKAVDKLSELGAIVSMSSVYETAAWGMDAQGDFLNIAICFETKLEANSLLRATQQIENELGRVRTIRWGPRTLDIDILLYNNEIIKTDGLTVPHPYMQERRFVLVPLAEIAAEVTHPIFGQTIGALLEICPDKQAVTYKSAW